MPASGLAFQALAVFLASCGFLMQMLGFPKQVLLNKELYHPGSPKEPECTFKQEQSTVYKMGVRERYSIKDTGLVILNCLPTPVGTSTVSGAWTSRQSFEFNREVISGR